MAFRSWRIKTPLGDFRLELAQKAGSLPSDEERERFQHVWFFARTQLLLLAPEALEAALGLLAALEWGADGRPPRRMDPQGAQLLAQELERAALRGRLVLTKEPGLGALAWAGKPASKGEWTPPPKPNHPVPEGAWIELELRNQLGEPVAYRPFRVIQEGRVMREGMTNATGFARVEHLRPGTCELEFTDLDETDFHFQPALPGAAPAAAAGPVAKPPEVGEPSDEPLSAAEPGLTP